MLRCQTTPAGTLEIVQIGLPQHPVDHMRI